MPVRLQTMISVRVHFPVFACLVIHQKSFRPEKPEGEGNFTNSEMTGTG
jgi:hypothetical protein